MVLRFCDCELTVLAARAQRHSRSYPTGADEIPAGVTALHQIAVGTVVDQEEVSLVSGGFKSGDSGSPVSS
jgi:hypothetical protein